MASPSPLAEERWQLTQRVWNELRADNLEILNDYYDPELRFQDPISSIKGLESMKAYYENLYQNVKDIEFEFTHFLYDETQQFFSWTMRLKAKGLNRGRPVAVEGTSYLRFSEESGKVIQHRDYFDTGEFIYDNIFGLRWIHRMVRRQLHGSQP